MRITSFFLVIILLFSCVEKGNQEEDNTYQVVSLLYQEYAKPLKSVFPPPPPDSLNYVLSSKDSAQIDSVHREIKKERSNKRFIVAIYPYFFSYNNPHNDEFLDSCYDFNTVLKNLVENKDSLKVDINKIVSKKNDSIILYSKELSKDRRKDFYNFDMLVSFSNISFNSNYTKAIVVGAYSHSRLAGASILFFLEKIEGQWIIKCKKGLSIS